MHLNRILPVLALAGLLAASTGLGCSDGGNGNGDADANVDAFLEDGGDTGVADADVEVDGDVDVDADVEIDAAPNPNVYELPPTGQTTLSGFTNAGYIITYADSRSTSLLSDDVYYVDLVTMLEHQVTNREMPQGSPCVYENEIIFHDFQYSDAPSQNFQIELHHFDILSEVDTRLTNEVSNKLFPVFNGEYILYRSNQGCGDVNIYNLTLMNRATTEATVVAECGQAAETHSISQFYAAWAARPVGGGSKDVFVRDLQAEYTFRVDSTEVGTQYFPHTDEDRVVWQDDRDGRREVYMYTFATGQEECLTPDEWEQGWPHLRDGIVSWSDYSYSQQSGQTGASDIVVHEIATGVSRRVTSQSRTWMPRFVDSGWMLYGLWITGNQFKLYAHDLVADGILTNDGHVIP